MQIQITEASIFIILSPYRIVMYDIKIWLEDGEE